MARSTACLKVFMLAVGVANVWLLSSAFVSGTSRREVLGAAAAGAVALGGQVPAQADWQGEPVMALQVYGPQIMGLKDAVKSGDVEAVSAKLNSFDLFASGVYKNKPVKKEEVSAIIDELADAIDKKNKAGIETSYDKFVKATSLDALFSLPKSRSYHLVSTASSMQSVR